MKYNKKKADAERDFWNSAYLLALETKLQDLDTINYLSASSSLNTFARGVADQALIDRNKVMAKIGADNMTVELEEFDG